VCGLLCFQEDDILLSGSQGRQYVKFSPLEDDIILQAVSQFGRGDYQRVISALVERSAELPNSTAAFYCSPNISNLQKRNRIYRRQKTLLNPTR
jgi:hypothetical protein